MSFFRFFRRVGKGAWDNGRFSNGPSVAPAHASAARRSSTRGHGAPVDHLCVRPYVPGPLPPYQSGHSLVRPSVLPNHQPPGVCRSFRCRGPLAARCESNRPKAGRARTRHSRQTTARELCAAAPSHFGNNRLQRDPGAQIVRSTQTWEDSRNDPSVCPQQPAMGAAAGMPGP